MWALTPRQIEVLRAAAVLGRSFDYTLLVEVAEDDEATVLAALESAIAQQLVEENADASEAYTWRHALTQEAIASDTVVPKRQRFHSRAADALRRRDGSAMLVARHLIGAGRADEAVEACLRAAGDAERAVAFTEAVDLLERVLPHVSDPRERALLLSRMGGLRWANGEPAAAEQLLEEAVTRLDELGLAVDAAHARIHLGRSRWELDRPEAAMQAFEQARDALEGAVRPRSSRLPTSGSRASTPSSSRASSAPRRPSVRSKSPSRPGRTSSASGPCRSSRSGRRRPPTRSLSSTRASRRPREGLRADRQRRLPQRDLDPRAQPRGRPAAAAREGRPDPELAVDLDRGFDRAKLGQLALGRPREALEQARDALAHFDSFGATVRLALAAGSRRGAARARPRRGGRG